MRHLKIIFLILVSTGCVDPVIISSEQDSPKVVIDAMFTDDPAFNTVRISSSAGFSNNYPFVPFNAPIRGAQVRVFSEDNTHVFTFTETEPGMHTTSAAGVIGQSYYVEIVLPDNTVYRSQSEKIPERVSLDQLTFAVEEELVIDESSGSRVEQNRIYFDVYANVSDPGAKQNYYMWRTLGTFEYFTLPVGDGPCGYCDCWATFGPLLDHVSVFSDEHIDGSAFKHKIARILYDRDTKFLARAHQFSISEKAYRYWNSIYKQQTAVGSIFDPMPQRIKGNLYRHDATEEIVLGFFTTATVSFNQLLIKRNVEAARLGIKDPYLKQPSTGDCRLLFNNTTHIRPPEFYD